jgi:nicotinate-nucleotide--dimethylbenzimidazole phosphoribosyltransferase
MYSLEKNEEFEEIITCGINKKNNNSETHYPETLKILVNRVHPVLNSFMPIAQKKIDSKTKPVGALGILEDLAVKISTIQQTLNPCVENKKLFVFAGDHGVVEEGVSAYPSKVTGQMVQNFLNGGAAINVICRQYEIDLSVIDMGVNVDFKKHDKLKNKKVRKGTRNFALENAMTEVEALQAIHNGAEVYYESNKKSACDIVGLGEMGIGNTSSATAIISAVTGLCIENAVGRGTGIDDKGLERKREVLKKALNFHKPNPNDGIDILCKVGGYEIAGMCGAAIAAASKGKCIVLDGVISTAAGLIASLICPDIKGYFISGHKSVEKCQQAALKFLGIEPIVNLNMRLGEGTGAAITINLIDTACRIMREMASFNDAGVSNKVLS